MVFGSVRWTHASPGIRANSRKGIRPLQPGPITPLPLPGTGHASVGVLGLAGNFSILRPQLAGACPSSQPPPPKPATWGHRRRPRLTWARPPVEPGKSKAPEYDSDDDGDDAMLPAFSEQARQEDVPKSSEGDGDDPMLPALEEEAGKKDMPQPTEGEEC